jgi:hypothetical protein
VVYNGHVQTGEEDAPCGSVPYLRHVAHLLPSTHKGYLVNHLYIHHRDGDPKEWSTTATSKQARRVHSQALNPQHPAPPFVKHTQRSHKAHTKDILSTTCTYII